jgi:predicted Zn-ribbon and HTH transcriptional regulator
MPFYGNVNKVLADAKQIAERFCNTDVTFDSLRREYKVSYPPLKRAILTQISASKYRMVCKKNAAISGVKSRFRKGHPTWNKGMKGWYAPGTEATRFKPGQIRGGAARRYRPVGCITIRNDSLSRQYRYRKRKEGMPPWPRNRRRYIKIKDTGPTQYCWVPYARYLWEQKYGSLPSGHFIIHEDGNTMNDVLSNLVYIDRKGHLAAIRTRGGEGLRQKRIRSRIKTCKKTRRDKQYKKLIRENLKGRVVFECGGCGANYPPASVPDRCPHCSSNSFIKTHLRPRLVVQGDMSSLVA